MKKFRVTELDGIIHLEEKCLLGWFYETDSEGDRMKFNDEVDARNYATRVYGTEAPRKKLLSEFEV